MTELSDGTGGSGPASTGATPNLSAADVQIRILSAYKKMLGWQFGGTVLLAGGTAVVLVICYAYGKVSPPLLVLVMLAGMLGAFFSALMRLYGVDQASIGLIPAESAHPQVH